MQRTRRQQRRNGQGVQKGKSRQSDDRDSPETVRHWREREKPEPSFIWQTTAVVFLGFAFAAAMGALTVPDEMAVRPSELSISAVAFLVLAIVCFLAHWDVNRGRTSRRYETKEVPGGQDFH